MLGKDVLYAIESLEKNGFSAYLVGGCVRDILMGKTPSDFDIATNALPEEIKRCFPREKKVLSGEKHGTIAPVIDGKAIEITTYRIDGKYSDSRHPEKVLFTKELKEDLMRRDFTVNAMAMDKNLNLFDPLSGKEDLDKKIIKCVGEPDRRFSEDALRIMRALRFSATLGFAIDKNTEESLLKNKELLLNISKERIYSELKKLMAGRDKGRVISSFKSVFSVINPLFEKINPEFAGEISESLSVNFALLLDGLTFAEIKEVMGSLKADKKTTHEVLSLVKLYGKAFSDIKAIKYLLRDFDCEILKMTAELKRLKEEIDDARLKEILSMIDECEKSCTKITDLVIGGDELKELGFGGRKIGTILNYLLDEVIEENIKNDRGSLIECAKRQGK